jgi:hypothetical protein
VTIQTAKARLKPALTRISGPPQTLWLPLPGLCPAVSSLPQLSVGGRSDAAFRRAAVRLKHRASWSEQDP